MTIEAYGRYIHIKRDIAATESMGLELPEGAKQKPNFGTILSVGNLVEDKSAKPGKRAMFNKTVGADYDVNGEQITVLREEQLLGVI